MTDEVDSMSRWARQAGGTQFTHAQHTPFKHELARLVSAQNASDTATACERNCIALLEPLLGGTMCQGVAAMAAAVNDETDRDFYIATDAEPHKLRRRAMLTKYGPEIRKLYGYDPSTAVQVQALPSARPHRVCQPQSR